ncbi:MAG: tRNA (adenosine(37)-N6)-threonylcarbamoyltransferase complex transferase subunit TsaD [Planctomycetes bacterium]|nr:tRNA (adenosine(37)-N6)-threonylcarbamoyltransferase complex transferase subunit TsaD [Planctomycetota bacterium]
MPKKSFTPLEANNSAALKPLLYFNQPSGTLLTGFICLGIETSCDETAVSVVRNGREVLADVVFSQAKLHSVYGGVVPEIACRAHIETILPILQKALKDAHIRLSDVNAVAVTNTPGLVGALLVGVSVAKTLAWLLNKPLIPVNHIYAHLYAAHLNPCYNVIGLSRFSGINDEPLKQCNTRTDYPYLGLIVSGGHTSLYRVTSPTKVSGLPRCRSANRDRRSRSAPTKYRLLGRTIDDAAGEAFDKVAAILGLSYPGGPAIEKTARTGNPNAIRFPRGFADDRTLNFSFSGLKTAVLYHCKGQNASAKSPLKKGVNIANVAASFQEAVVDTLIERVSHAARKWKPKSIVLGGGVAANQRLRDKLQARTTLLNIPLRIPPKRLCLDNAAMVAGLAYHYRRSPANLYLDAVV